MKIDVVIGTSTAYDVDVTCVCEDRYRLEEEDCLCLCADSLEEAARLPQFGDVMLAQRVDAKTVRFVWTYERAPYRRFSYVLSQEAIEAQSTRALLLDVVSVGGRWELHAGGVLLISVPGGSALNPGVALVQSGDKG